MNASVDFLIEDPSMDGRAAHSAHLWFDANGKRLPIRYTYRSDYRYYDIFEEIIKFWTDNTCLTFKMEQSVDCATAKVPILSIKDLRDNTDRYGIDPKTPCMVTSLGGGFVDVAQRTVLGVLGMLPYTQREDSDKFISMNEENLKTYLKVWTSELRSELTSYHKCRGKTPVLPTPFDFLSRTMPSSNELGSLTETRPVYVTVDPQHQYLIDHASASKRSPTFYDVLVVNLLYKCSAEWASACSGTVPKCKNHGYLMKTCRCRCPPGFGGDVCQTETGPVFPLQPGAFQLTVSDAKTYDFAALNIKGVELADGDSQFKFYVFIIVHIAPKDASQLPSISMALPFSKAGATLTRLSTKLLRYVASADCLVGLRLLWGSGRRLACDCFSSLVNNEPPSEARVFRGRRPNMGMTLINNLGRTFTRESGVTELTSQFRLKAEFRPPPSGLAVAEKPGAQPVPVSSGDGGGGGGGGAGGGLVGGGGGGSGGNISDSSGDSGGSGGVISDGNGSDANALKGLFTDNPGLGVAATLGPLSLLLLLCLLLLFTRCKRRRKVVIMQDESESDEEDADGETESDISDEG